MTSDREAGLLRVHRDVQRAGYLELFFDLVYVFAFIELSHNLVKDLTWRGVFQLLVTLLALWWVWSFTAWTTNRFDPSKPAVQLMIISIMLGSFLMAIAAPDAFGESGLLFATAYVAIQIGRTLFVVLTRAGQPERASAVRILPWFGVTAVPWIAGALAPSTAAHAVLWTLAVALTFMMIAIDFRVPGFGSARTVDLAISGEHLSERYRQLTIIALGHTILVAGLVARSHGLAGARIGATAVAFAVTVLLWRIYYFHAGALLESAITSAPAPARLGRSASSAHLLMVAGIVTTSAGQEIIIRHPAGHTDPPWIAVILGGPALFLVGRAWLDHLTFSYLARSRPIGLLVLAAMAPAMVLLPPIMVAITASLVLAGIAFSDTIAWRAHPRQPAPPPR